MIWNSLLLFSIALTTLKCMSATASVMPGFLERKKSSDSVGNYAQPL